MNSVYCGITKVYHCWSMRLQCNVLRDVVIPAVFLNLITKALPGMPWASTMWPHMYVLEKSLVDTCNVRACLSGIT